MIAKTQRYIAERKLLFSKKGGDKRSEVAIRITEPYILRQQDVELPVDGLVASCRISFDGLDEAESVVYGMDSLQAVNLASNIEAVIKRLSNKYDFFWITGEPYFEE